MDIHKNARLTPLRREEMALAVIEGGCSKAHAARTYGVSAKIVARWVERARVMSDNGSCYRAKAFAKACRDLGLKHVRTRPYTPKTNGKAERFIQTALREWAYAFAYPTSQRRAAELPVWLHRYNWHRPHGSLKSKTSISRLALTEDNLLRLHI